MKQVLEKWKDVVGYEGYYQVSSYGRVCSLDRLIKTYKGINHINKGVILKPGKRSKYGHLGISLWKFNKSYTFQVHRLVLEAFIGPCPDNFETCHNDGNPINNRLDNLRWGTRKSNCDDQINHGTTLRKQVKRSDGIIFLSMAIAAEITNCSQGNISQCCNGIRYTASGFKWEFYYGD